MDKAAKSVFDSHKGADVIYKVGPNFFVTKRSAENHAGHTGEKIEVINKEEAPKKPARKKVTTKKESK